MIITNYELGEKIAETPYAVIYKAYRKQNPQRWLTLKVFKTNSLSVRWKDQFRQKIEHLKVLNDPILITPISFGEMQDTCFITQNFFEGITLDNLIRKKVKEDTALSQSPLPLKDFFILACQLARALDKVHEAGIIHGGIKPHNILVNPDTLEVRLIDFISALDVRDVSHFIYDRSFVREALAYTSPEQTGRISHRVVFASDMYSLGIVFYELLTGRLPFSSHDPLEMIHSHLAEEAPAVHQVNPEIPTALSHIISKLMLKEPEKRYQSSNGLLADLLRCQEEYTATGAISEFPLESRVYTHRVTFISRMVGRDEEARTILDEYEQVANGKFRSMFISGLSGIGKTRLIQELQKPIVKHRGYFTSGKFDVYQKNIPYSSLIQSLRNLMRTFLTESDDRVAAWKARILQAVEGNGKLLTDVVPELQILIGPQPEVPNLPPVEALNRFHDVFDKFLTCLASKENPLTLFIDDLQWCDVASFDFFTNLFANYQNHPYLFFLGAYRHNEVDSSHPMAKLLYNARETQLPVKEIRLGPLKPEHCCEMVAYILDSPVSQTRALAEFISNLSEGNPLFVSESLSYLHNENLLFTDEEGQWCWDMAKIHLSDMPKTVVALFSSKIQKLPADAIDLLEYCACMGNSFSPAELAGVQKIAMADVFEILKPALGQGLLIENKDRLQFIHDKVQEASLAEIPLEKRRKIHWQVGRYLLEAIPGGVASLLREDRGAALEKLDNLFTVVSHLNLARGEKPGPETAYLLSSLNYHAGNKALDSLATEAANEYFKLSRELLLKDCWEDHHYEQTFRIYQKAAKTELMCGNYENSEKLLNQLLEHARTDLDKAECLAEQTTSLSSIGNFIKAIETANRGLAYFGQAIPEDPEAANRKREKLLSEINAQKIDIWDTILNMPFTKDRKSKIELKFYSELIPDLYMSGLVPQLYLSAVQSTRHCLAGGMDESVIYSFSIMGLQTGEAEEFEQAFKYEDLARDLSAKYPNTFGATRGMNGIVWCNAHSRSHPREIVDYCLKGIQCGKNCGDLYNAGLSYGPLMWNLQVQGENLEMIEDYAKECLQFSNRYHLSFSVGLAEAMQAGWIAPMKNGYVPAPMAEKLKQWEKDSHVASAGSYFVHLALSHYYLDEYEEAQECLETVNNYLTGLTDNVLKRQWHVFRVLNALKLYEKGLRFRTKEELMAEIRPLIRKVETWAAMGPLLKPYLVFLYAEKERVLGEFREARSLYLDAINIAHQQQYTFLEGHINECLGEFLRQADQCSVRLYLTEAARLYRVCHAERKENNLQVKYSAYLREDKIPPAFTTAMEPSSAVLPSLDVDYLMKSFLAISGEIEQEALLKKIMQVMLEVSGAQSGYLLVQEGGNLLVRAESRITEEPAAQTLNRKLEEVASLCPAVVRYVYRTGEKLLFKNVSQECPLRGSSECRDFNLRSLLCLPVVKQAKTVGILYLENQLMEGVFTTEITRMIEWLASEAANSLEKSRLMEEMKMVEDELLDWKEELELVSDSGPTLISYVDTDYRYRRVNKAYEHYFGEAARDLPGKPVWEAFEAESWQIVHQYMKQALDGERVTYEHELAFAATGSFWFSVSYTPDRDEWGRVRGFVTHAVDITETKRAQEALRKAHDELEQRVQERTSELRKANEMLQKEIAERERAQQAIAAERQRFNEVLDMMPVYAILLTDDYQVSFANRFFEERFGKSNGKRCYEYLFGRTDPCENCESYTVKRTQQPHHWEWLGPDNRYYDIFDFPFTDTDGSSIILEVGIDMTEVKRAEAALRKAHDELEQRVQERTAELEASNKELEAFSYSVSHDLRAPLRSMEGFSQALAEDYGDKLDETGRDYLRRIQDSSTLMAELLDDLLELSRISRAEMQREKVNLTELVEDISAGLRRMEPKRNIEFSVAPGLVDYGDSRLLRSVLENLLDNAWKFTGKTAQARVEFGVTECKGKKAYFVRDNGAGFDMTYVNKLFNPFQRLHKASEFKGTGIGLASVQRIISRHGGEVWAKGAVGKGATFYFTLG